MNKEELELWYKYRKSHDPAVRNELVVLYAGFVKYLVGRMDAFTSSVLQKDDLLSMGSLGLMAAIERYDPDQGVEFTSFAGQRIRGSIFDGIRENDWASRSARRKEKRLEEAYFAVQSESGGYATDKDVAEKLGITEPELRNWLSEVSLLDMTSLDVPVFDPGGTETAGDLKCVIADPNTKDPSRGLCRKEMVEELGKAIDRLSPREKQILSLYWREGLTLREIAEVLGVTEARVCQINKSVLLKLRKYMGSCCKEDLSLLEAS